jgi:cytosine/adenosine deaminase-related metal-dependent hydrolase
MTTVIHHTTLVTGDRDPAIHVNAAIAIENDLIAAIGSTDEITARFPNAESVDGRGKLVIPGFANCHTHFVRILARGIFEDQSAPNRPPFTRKGRFPFPTLNPEQRAAMARLGVLEALRSGTTTAMDITNNIGDYAKAIVVTGLRLVLAEQVSDRAKGARVGEAGIFVADPALADKGLQRIADLHAKWDGAENGRVSVAVAAHAPDMVSPELLEALRDLREKLDTVTTIHLNQYWGEVEVIKNTYGMLPTEYLARHGFLHERLVAAHCRCMTPEEEKILGASGASVSFNPVVAARSGNSPRITDLEASGCRIALGTDEFTEDMVQVLRSAVLNERLRLNGSERPRPEEAMLWGTVNGYRALNLKGCGFLQVGSKADLIVVGTRHAHLVPTLRPVAVFVYQGQARDVESVMVDGRWLLRDGKVLSMDEEEVIREADRVSREIWLRYFKDHPDLEMPGGFDTRFPG